MCNTSQHVCVENTKGKLGGSVTEHMLSTHVYLDSGRAHVWHVCVSGQW